MKGNQQMKELFLCLLQLDPQEPRHRIDLDIHQRRLAKQNVIHTHTIDGVLASHIKNQVLSLAANMDAAGNNSVS